MLVIACSYLTKLAGAWPDLAGPASQAHAQLGQLRQHASRHRLGSGDGLDRTLLSSAAEVARLDQRTPLLEDAFLAPEIDDGSRAVRLQASGDALRSSRRAMPPQAARRARRTRPDDARASFIRDCS